MCKGRRTLTSEPPLIDFQIRMPFTYSAVRLRPKASTSILCLISYLLAGLAVVVLTVMLVVLAVRFMFDAPLWYVRLTKTLHQDEGFVNGNLHLDEEFI
jgi:hypothetical protein